ncbi:5-formyltetrahydrofolate cyclo-ligase [Roseinatronobacter bogoriensis]|uniref:5-formyltetrahydrofolate cyclo-ligase n=1 Tax=Roseinatronobacter bogoriensis subsp. barguzinensis TaxID=441209 RepID=A0A2K8KB97_9RHOB|nr:MULTISPECIES: 5-formyltetrahydrofolate cyclo-ligase [Rhodobaca]ATX66719.1 5-formyltetrahydrofolate cyclo-ligase [Rhodobaca barguzinensis]MBB4206175.1 5-formyltetrahydrofolate cyclo-ligase [Rhodobaca bogoriensis DSM 18756]TDW40919.1 5-formyltetrahydrofolate cyclo-ligase [Rhodobaca barguzinensis]TDY74903.1 5-formyltetrahydrofolate cyclo-ligase [Rhodobaca bogoriensis DSM 18756]
MIDTVTTQKAELRQRMAKLRGQAFHESGASERIESANMHLTRWLEAQLSGELGQVVLSGYMPMRSEIDPIPAMTAHPGPVCVPVIVAKAQPLEFHRWTPEAEMVEGQFKARTPVARELLTPQVLIVPLLAFDRGGYRLGYGGGFYDRTLQGLRARGPALAVGFAFDEQEVGLVPRDATDQPLNAIVTPSGVIVP